MILIPGVLLKMGFEFFNHKGIKNTEVNGQNVVLSVPLTELLTSPIQNY